MKEYVQGGRRALGFVLLLLMSIGFCLFPVGQAVRPPTATADQTMNVNIMQSCGLSAPAFCDDFSEGATTVPGARGSLDPARWSDNRFTGEVNGPQLLLGFVPTTAQFCKETIYNVLPDKDSFMCGPQFGEMMHWMEAFDDNHNYVYDDARIRQPFDFAGRTGTISYAVDNKTSGSHGWWTELWVTDTPMPGPNFQHNLGPSDDIEQEPRNGIGISFFSNCGVPIPPGGAGAGVSGVGQIAVYQNYQVSFVPNSLGDNVNCVTTQPDDPNTIQVKLSQTQVQVWESDHGSTALQLIAQAPLDLPFTRGYVHFAHVQYNADKFTGATSYQTYHWHSMGFDGPVLPTPRAYEVPDSLTPATMIEGESGVNIGYLVQNGQLSNGQTSIPNLRFTGVNLSGATSASLNLATVGFGPGDTLQYRFNNGPWRQFVCPTGISNAFRQGFAIPVSVSDLVNGDNTVTFQTNASAPNDGPNSVVLGNIDLEVTAPGSSPTSTSTATMASTTTSTAMSMSTSTVSSTTSSTTRAMSTSAASSTTVSVSTRSIGSSATGSKVTPPTTVGPSTAGSALDDDDANHMNGSRITSGTTSRRVTSISAYVGAVEAAPHNQYQVAIYSDQGGRPSTLIAKSGTGTLTANAWNTIAISATLAPNTSYWLMYNTNGSKGTVNNLHYDPSGSAGEAWSASGTAFGTWPTSFGPAAAGPGAFSLYATYH